MTFFLILVVILIFVILILIILFGVREYGHVLLNESFRNNNLSFFTGGGNADTGLFVATGFDSRKRTGNQNTEKQNHKQAGNSA